MIRGAKLNPAEMDEFLKNSSAEKDDPLMTHGNTRYPELHDKAVLEALVNRYGTAARIARVLGCKRQNVDAAMRRFGIKVKRYALSDERKRSLRMRE